MNKILLINSAVVILVTIGHLSVVTVKAEIHSNDSISYLKKCLFFIKQVKGKEMAQADFVLIDGPCRLDRYDCLKEVLFDTTVFSKNELDTIASGKFRRLSKWPAALFGDIKIISADTITAVFNDRNRGWRYYYAHIGKSISAFSAPYFFKHDNYCLFYWEESCGYLCGEGHLFLYKKEDGNWIKIKEYCNWIS